MIVQINASIEYLNSWLTNQLISRFIYWQAERGKGCPVQQHAPAELSSSWLGLAHMPIILSHSQLPWTRWCVLTYLTDRWPHPFDCPLRSHALETGPKEAEATLPPIPPQRRGVARLLPARAPSGISRALVEGSLICVDSNGAMGSFCDMCPLIILILQYSALRMWICSYLSTRVEIHFALWILFHQGSYKDKSRKVVSWFFLRQNVSETLLKKWGHRYIFWKKWSGEV